MAMDSKTKVISYRGGMYLLLTLLILSLIGGFIIYRYSLLHHVNRDNILDEAIFYIIIGVAVATVMVSLLLAVRLYRNLRSLGRVAKAMEAGADIDSMPEFSNDELGDLSRHIISLYSRLRQTTTDLEREHDRRLHEQQEKLRIKRQLTNNINHELKTPVAAIRGYLETMITSTDMSDEERKSFIDKSYAHCLRLTQLLQDVSTITRLAQAS
jgi:signal transduction histidine kinase